MAMATMTHNIIVVAMHMFSIKGSTFVVDDVLATASLTSTRFDVSFLIFEIREALPTVGRKTKGAMCSIVIATEMVMFMSIFEIKVIVVGTDLLAGPYMDAL